MKEAAKKVAAEIKREDLDLGKILRDVIPFKINRLELRDSEVTLTDATDPKRPKFWIKDIEFVAENLVSREALDANVPLLVSARATVQKTGVLKVLVTADLLAKKPTFTGQAQLSGLNLESLYEWAAAKAGVSPHGTVDIFVNFNSAEGALAGDVKLLAHDVRVDALEGKLANAAKAAAINIGTKILSDEKHDRVVATTLPLRGSLEKRDAQIWPTVLGLIRNAFVDSLEWGFGDLPIKTAPKSEGVIPQAVEGRLRKELPRLRRALDAGVADSGTVTGTEAPEELELTGTLNDATQRALGAWQHAEGIPETGLPDYDTLDRLGIKPDVVYRHRPPAEKGAR